MPGVFIQVKSEGLMVTKGISIGNIAIVGTAEKGFAINTSPDSGCRTSICASARCEKDALIADCVSPSWLAMCLIEIDSPVVRKESYIRQRTSMSNVSGGLEGLFILTLWS